MEVMGRHEVPEQNLLHTKCVAGAEPPTHEGRSSKCVGEAELEFYWKPKKSCFSTPEKNAVVLGVIFRCFLRHYLGDF